MCIYILYKIYFITYKLYDYKSYIFFLNHSSWWDGEKYDLFMIIFYSKNAVLNYERNNRDARCVAMSNYWKKSFLGTRERNVARERVARDSPLLFLKGHRGPLVLGEITRSWLAGLAFASARSASRSARRRGSSVPLKVHSKRRRKMLHLLLLRERRVSRQMERGGERTLVISLPSTKGWECAWIRARATKQRDRRRKQGNPSHRWNNLNHDLAFGICLKICLILFTRL